MNGYIIVNYAGKESKFRLGINELINFKKATGKDALDVLSKISKESETEKNKKELNAVVPSKSETSKEEADFVPSELDFEILRAFLWAGLSYERKNLSIEEVGEIMEHGLSDGSLTLESVGKHIGDAILASGVFKAVAAKNPGNV